MGYGDKCSYGLPEQKRISYSFIQNFDIFDEKPSEDIRVINLNPEPYTVFKDTYRKILVKSPERLSLILVVTWLWHTDREGHFLFSKYLKNSS